MTVSLFEDNNAIESLRSSDFDAISAYGEVVDNAIEAGATSVRIQSKTQTGARAYEHIEQLMFGDNGHGMPPETLHRCLKIGWSSRFNSRDGIGRFGVGMTMGAIHECRRIEIFSKTKLTDWHWTYIDLDEVEKGAFEGIPEPQKCELPKGGRALVGKDHGTLVVWKKYDKQAENFAQLRKDTRTWLGRTYRYFIWDDGVEIYMDGQLVPAIDPLYVRTEKTAFPDDPPAAKFEDIIFEWPIDQLDRIKGGPEKSTIRICMSLLHEDRRPYQGSGNLAENTARHIDENEGISILRNRREVFYGHIPHWKVKGIPGWNHFEEKDRWWGCEIHFDAHLDRSFAVKNIKRGAIPVRELKHVIKKRLKPTRETCIERVDEQWKKFRQKQNEEKAASTSGLHLGVGHEDAEEIGKKTATPKGTLDADKDFDKEVEEFMDKRKERYIDEQRAQYKAIFGSQPFTIVEEHFRRDNQLFEASHLGGKDIIEYNLDHPFFENVYALLEQVDEESEDALQSRELKTLLDLCLVAYAKAETQFSAEDTYSADNFLSTLRTFWGQFLKSYVSTWLKERKETE